MSRKAIGGPVGDRLELGRPVGLDRLGVDATTGSAAPAGGPGSRSGKCQTSSPARQHRDRQQHEQPEQLGAAEEAAGPSRARPRRSLNRQSSGPGSARSPASSSGVSSAKLILVELQDEKTSITFINSEYRRSGSTLISVWSNGSVGSSRNAVEFLLEGVLLVGHVDARRSSPRPRRAALARPAGSWGGSAGLPAGRDRGGRRRPALGAESSRRLRREQVHRRTAPRPARRGRSG